MRHTLWGMVTVGFFFGAAVAFAGEWRVCAGSTLLAFMLVSIIYGCPGIE